MKNDELGINNADTHPDKKAGPRRIDVIIWAVVILVGAALISVYFFMKSPGSSVVIAYDGGTVCRYPLNEDRRVYISIRDGRAYVTESEGDVSTPEFSEGGINRLVIENGEAYMEYADCPDRLCVGQGRISHTGESIICLPHRLSIRVEGEAAGEPDAIVGAHPGR